MLLLLWWFTWRLASTNVTVVDGAVAGVGCAVAAYDVAVAVASSIALGS